MTKTWAFLNLISVVLVIGVNYISQALRLNETTIGDISQRYDNLFTPASYAFAIWGLIFLGLIVYVIFQLFVAFKDRPEKVQITKTGPWFFLANVLNAAWVFAFVYDLTGLSVLIMLGILASLLKVIVATDMERWDAPRAVIAFFWWPICLYSGWIAVATIANIAAYLTKLGWQGGPFSETAWAIIMIAVAGSVNAYMIYARNMREFATVGAWALVAIYVRHDHTQPNIAYTALLIALALFTYILYHGYRNRDTNPFLGRSPV